MERNELYPIFLKASQLNTLIVGGGKVALEKLTFLLKSSPNAKVKMVAIQFNNSIVELSKIHDVQLIEAPYDIDFLEGQNIVIAATNEHLVNVQIYTDSKALGILVNVADAPNFCDFYLGGIVTKGNVKIAISTNGKSPTTAKRLREYLEETIPDDINDLVENLSTYRKTIKGDFTSKVVQLNELTKSLISNN